MKLLHISDLHIGKRLYGYSLIEEQQYILSKIEEITRLQQIDALLIAGDVYDRAVPAEAAITILDDFLTAVLQNETAVFLISGNHDSAQRLQFGSRILQKSGLYIAGAYNGEPLGFTLEDQYGEVAFTLLPYVRPYDVERFSGCEIGTETEAVAQAISGAAVNLARRNVLIAHQYVAAKGKKNEFSESESTYFGGLNPVDASLLENYDYVALGHLHGAQKVGSAHIRYAGAPLQYAFNDKGKKGCIFIELRQKGDITIEPIPIEPKTPLVSKKGQLKELLQNDTDKNSFLQAILTDEFETPSAMAMLKEVYPNIMHMCYDNARSRALMLPFEQLKQKSILEHFRDFYQMQNGMPLPQKAESILKDIGVSYEAT